MNEDFIALGKPEWVKQFCMLPHDIVHSMFQFPGVFHHIWTGVPGDLEKYWDYNLDLASSLGIGPEEPWHVLKKLSGVFSPHVWSSHLQVFENVSIFLVHRSAEEFKTHVPVAWIEALILFCF